MPYPSTAHQVSPKMSLSSLFRIHSWLWQWLIMAHMSAQRGSSMQSVLMQFLDGSGEVRAESVVHMGKQGSGDQSPVISFASSSLPEAKAVVEIMARRKNNFILMSLLQEAELPM